MKIFCQEPGIYDTLITYKNSYLNVIPLNKLFFEKFPAVHWETWRAEKTNIFLLQYVEINNAFHTRKLLKMFLEKNENKIIYPCTWLANLVTDDGLKFAIRGGWSIKEKSAAKIFATRDEILMGQTVRR